MSPPSRNTTARSLRLILRPQTGRFHAKDKVHGLLRSRTSFSPNVSPLYRFQSRRNCQKQLFWDFYASVRKSPRTHENPNPAVRLYAATFFGSLYIYTEKQHICMLDISLAIRNASYQNNRLQLTYLCNGCRNVTQDLVFGSLFTCRNCRNQHRFAVKTSFFSVQKSSVMKNYTLLFLQYIQHSIHTLINYMKTTYNSNTLLGKQLLNQKGNPHTCRNQHRFAVKTSFFSVQKSTK